MEKKEIVQKYRKLCKLIRRASNEQDIEWVEQLMEEKRKVEDEYYEC